MLSSGPVSSLHLAWSGSKVIIILLWLSGRVLDLRRKGHGFEPPQCQVKNQIKQTNKMKAGKYKSEGVKGT